MKKVTLFVLILLMANLGMNQEVNGQTKVFDQTITWEHAPYDHGGYGFYWWHRTDGYSIINYGDMPSDNWASPNNYYNGEFTMSVEVVSQPSDDPFWIQFGIWGDYDKGSSHTETVAARQYVNGGTGSSGSYSLGSPSGWWNKQAGDPLDFSRADDFYRIGVVLWNTDPLCIPMGTEWSSSGCPEFGERFFPMTVRIRVYASSGTYVPPITAPNYSIDYPNERTNKVVSSDDQYSYNSDFSTVVDGNGQYLSLTPGTNVYFRKKADYSKTQTLTVPDRPGAPGFGIDYANERTSETVSSEYRYSSNSDMSSSTTGDGSYVSLTPGSNIYFIKSATSSNFASDKQTLNVSARPNAPSFGIDYVNERTNTPVSSEYQFSSSSDMSSATTGDGSYVSLAPGSSTYFRKLGTAFAFASNIQELIMPQVSPPNYSIDYSNERTNEVVATNDQYSYNSDFSTVFDGNGQYLSLTPGTNVYFREKSDPSKKQTLTVPGRPITPSFGIDYVNERTSSTVSSEYQHSINSDMSSSSMGNGTYVSLTPGSNKYFRRLATGSAFASSIQELVVPARPSAPNFGIDYPNERTSTTVSSAYQYSTSNDMSSSSTGIGSYVSLTPGTNLYFRKPASSLVFASAIQELIVPSRPSVPSFGIDYPNERTSSVVSSTFQYAANSDMSSATTGSGSYVSLTPGSNIYFRKLASVSSFASNIQELVVPARPSAPNFGTDYSNERTSTTVSSEYKYSTNNDMSSSLNGNGSYVSLTPGINLFFRRSANASAFSSFIQTLTVPSRPAATLFEIDYINERTSSVVSNEYQYSASSDMNPSSSGNGSYVVLTPGSNTYFRKSAGSSSFASSIQELIVPGRPVTPSFGIDFENERTSTTVTSEYQHSVNSDMSSASTGDGSQVALTPGSNKYFKKLGTASAFASNIQELIVPSRPGAPSFGIDYVNERTSTTVESSYDYATVSDMSDAVSGTGEYLELSPGIIRYFRKKANSSAFMSSTQTLAVPARPVAPSFQIDYIQEEISTPIGPAYIYGNNPDMSSATQGTGSIIQVTPGANIYIQAMATSSEFVSEIQTIITPERPAAPLVDINYITESTKNSISPELQYSGSIGFETVERGTGIALNLVPGEDLYFRRIATTMNFSSEVFQLLVHERPVISSEESGSTTLNPFIVDITFFQEIASLENSNLSVVNAEMKDLNLKSSGTSETVFEGQVYATVNDLITISVPANATLEGNFVANTFTISFTGQLPGVGIASAEINSFMVYPNPGKGVFHIQFEDFDAQANFKVQCYSITGKVVHTETFFGSYDMSLDLSSLSDGIYLMRLYKDDQITGVAKLIIN